MPPRAEMPNPPLQHNAAANPALRGPDRSTQLPNTAAELPRKTKNNVYIHPSMEIGQSQLVVNTLARKLISAGQLSGASRPMARDKGNQNTENPKPSPIDKWVANAAGGTNQRLKPGRAMVRSLSSKAFNGMRISPIFSEFLTS